jgi:hypothetical protein
VKGAGDAVGNGPEQDAAQPDEQDAAAQIAARAVGDDSSSRSRRSGAGGADAWGSDSPGAAVGQGNSTPGIAPAIATRIAHYLPGSDTEVTPQHPAWPTYLCLRQITTIAKTVVEDGVCPHWDIPLLQNTNIPVPDKPYGLGEPYRLRTIQKADSRTVDAMVEYTESFKAPGRTISASMHASLPEDEKDSYVKPSTTLVLPDDQWLACGGKPETIVPPPPMPAGLMDLQPILTNIRQELSGHTEVSQGTAPPGVDSGRAIALLQDANAGMTSFKAMKAAECVWRFGMLLKHNITWRMEAADLARIVKKQKEHVLAAMLQRERNNPRDITVVVPSGNGMVKAQKGQRAIAKMGAGLQSRETTQEQNDIDPKLERQRMNRERADAAGMMPGAMAPAVAAVAGPAPAAAAPPGASPAAPRPR